MSDGKYNYCPYCGEKIHNHNCRVELGDIPVHAKFQFIPHGPNWVKCSYRNNIRIECVRLRDGFVGTYNMTDRVYTESEAERD